MNNESAVHIALGFIFAIAIIAITALEVYFIPNFNSTEMFFLAMQNMGIAAFNGYYIGKIQLTPTGLTQTVEKSPA